MGRPEEQSPEEAQGGELDNKYDRDVPQEHAIGFVAIGCDVGVHNMVGSTLVIVSPVS
jgi:hypothetical protein